MDIETFYRTYVVPFSLFMIMVGLGLNLTLPDIKRVLIMPKAVLTGLTGQMLLLPVLAFALALVFPVSPVIAIGIILLSACPGGITSNAYVFASRGDIALSVTLTTISSLLTVITMPLLTWMALSTFAESGAYVDVPVTDMMRTLAQLTLLPIVLGMLVRHFRSELADRMKEPVRWLALLFLWTVIIGNTWFSLDTIGMYFAQAGLLVIVLNLSSMSMGYGLSKLARLNPEQTVTITFEVGIQNLSLALVLANTILQVPDYAIFTIIYGFLMKFSALGFMALSRRILGTTHTGTNTAKISGKS